MSFPNFLRNRNHRNEASHDRENMLLSIIPESVLNIKSCCYFFDLKMGCKLIAVLEGLSGLLEAFISYHEIGYYRQISYRHREYDIIRRDPISTLTLGLIGCLSAQVLLAGVIMQRKACLLFWIFVISISTVVFMIYNLNNLFIFDAVSAAIESYFLVIVLAYYLQLRRAENSNEEFEILFTASEPQLAK
ncbi:uncharacterized protein LOC117785197 [Drosophila innubila]|uniref:uncharacterized protein LOC117785197 n=1 Tax=Drosophila innubila TaxID=198719 RepID=UPI00148BA3B2|nr:uncharacterized protein LOC117785197 [Drosophila innubila]